MTDVGFTLKETVLERLQFAVTQTVSAAFLRDAKVDVVSDYLTEHLVVRLSSYVLADKLAEESRTFDFAWPASGWHRFKARHLPTLLRWRLVRPVRLHRESVQVAVRSWATFPDPEVAYPPELGRPVRYQQVVAYGDPGTA